MPRGVPKAAPRSTRFVQPPRLEYQPRPTVQNAPLKPTARSSTPLILAGIVVTVFGCYGVLVYKGYKKDAERAKTLDVPLDVSDRYDRIADYYDGDVGQTEFLMGINRLRKMLVARANGNVLEVSVGTGRNAKYYPLTKGIKSITMVDKSQEMIRLARMNWAKTNAWYINASFWIQDARQPVPLPDSEGFDTVVQTMGICSTPEPVELLKTMGRMTKKETGRIMLLEHGKSHYEWLNNIMDNLAPMHADRYGCWFNKDIGKIVEQSGLEVVEARRYHFGTTWWFELKPSQAMIAEHETERQNERPEDGLQSKAKQKPWWAVGWG